MNERGKDGKDVGRGREFADLVHQVLFTGNKKLYRPEAVAGAMGMGYHTLYKRASNEVMFSAEEIRALIAAAPDPRFANYLLHGTRFVAADRVEADGTDEAIIHRRATRVAIEATDVLKAVETALADDRICHQDVVALVPELEKAERALASLRLRIREMAPGSVKEKM